VHVIWTAGGLTETFDLITSTAYTHQIVKDTIKIHTVNGERFAGLNFRGFEEERESFSVNILQEL